MNRYLSNAYQKWKSLSWAKKMGITIGTLTALKISGIISDEVFDKHFCISEANLKAGRYHTLLTSAFCSFDLGYLIRDFIHLAYINKIDQSPQITDLNKTLCFLGGHYVGLVVAKTFDHFVSQDGMYQTFNLNSPTGGLIAMDFMLADTELQGSISFGISLSSLILADFSIFPATSKISLGYSFHRIAINLSGMLAGLALGALKQ